VKDSAEKILDALYVCDSNREIFFVGYGLSIFLRPQPDDRINDLASIRHRDS
jgi:hypothetical protein